MNRTGGEVIVDSLVEQRVPYLFGVCGHGVLGLLDAAYDRRDEIRTITTHDERVAGLMADAYFRVTGRPVATYSSCGPGSVNIAMAVASAFHDSSAFLAITGDAATSQMNRGAFQETGRGFQGDFATVLRPYVKRTFQAYRPEMLPLAMRQAYGAMVNGRPGPVHLDVPFNVFAERTDAAVPEGHSWTDVVSARPAADPDAVTTAAQLLARADRPLLVAGNGAAAAGCQAELRELSELLSLPVVTTPHGKGVVDERLRLSLGPTGRNGTYAANAAARSCDVLLAIGTRFDDRSTSGWIRGVTYDIPPTKLIHVDIDPSEIGRNYRPELGVVADARHFLRQLIDALGMDVAPAPQDWVRQVGDWRAAWDAQIEPFGRDESSPVNPGRLVAEIGRATPQDAIVLADVGIHHNWLLQMFRPPEHGRFLQAWGFATMGFGVAGSLGAQFAEPETPVLAVVGDGGFLMHANAVATAVQYDLPVVWLVWNNRGYGAIYRQQMGFFEERELATRFYREATGDPYDPDIAAMAMAMGAAGIRAGKPTEVAEALEHAFATRRPCVIEVDVDEYGSTAPATGSWDLPPLAAPPPNFGWEGRPGPLHGDFT